MEEKSENVTPPMANPSRVDFFYDDPNYDRETVDHPWLDIAVMLEPGEEISEHHSKSCDQVLEPAAIDEKSQFLDKSATELESNQTSLKEIHPLQSQVQGVLEDLQLPRRSLNVNQTELFEIEHQQHQLDATSKLINDHQKFFFEAHEIEQWIVMKKVDLKKIEHAKKINGVEKIQHQLSFFLKVTHTFSQRIEKINVIARQLHPNSKESEHRIRQINACWAEFFSRAKAVHSAIPVSLIGVKFQPKFTNPKKMLCKATVIAADSPRNIYIQINDGQFKDFIMLQNEMNVVLNQAAIQLEPSQIQIGMICSIKKMDKWIRCIVERVTPEKLCYCFDVDFGNRQFVPMSNCYILPKRFISFPVQATRCSLFGINFFDEEASKTKFWHQQAIFLVNSYLNENCVIFIESWDNSEVGRVNVGYELVAFAIIYKDGHQLSLNKTLCERKLVKQCAELDSLKHNLIRAEIAAESIIKIDHQTSKPLDGASAESVSQELGAASLIISESSTSGVNISSPPTILSFLKSVELEHLYDIFKREKITFNILLEMDECKLKDIGIHAYGHRHVLLKNMLDYYKKV